MDGNNIWLSTNDDVHIKETLLQTKELESLEKFVFWICLWLLLRFKKMKLLYLLLQLNFQMSQTRRNHIYLSEILYFLSFKHVCPWTMSLEIDLLVSVHTKIM
jgi:hypothetical protein